LSSSSKQPSNTQGTKEHQGDEDTIAFLNERNRRLAQEEEALRSKQKASREREQAILKHKKDIDQREAALLAQKEECEQLEKANLSREKDIQKKLQALKKQEELRKKKEEDLAYHEGRLRYKQTVVGSMAQHQKTSEDRHSTGSETERQLGVDGLTPPDVPQEDASEALRQVEEEMGDGSYHDDATLNSSWGDDGVESVTS